MVNSEILWGFLRQPQRHLVAPLLALNHIISVIDVFPYCQEVVLNLTRDYTNRVDFYFLDISWTRTHLLYTEKNSPVTVHGNPVQIPIALWYRWPCLMPTPSTDWNKQLTNLMLTKLQHLQKFRNMQIYEICEKRCQKLTVVSIQKRYPYIAHWCYWCLPPLIRYDIVHISWVYISGHEHDNLVTKRGPGYIQLFMDDKLYMTL